MISPSPSPLFLQGEELRRGGVTLPSYARLWAPCGEGGVLLILHTDVRHIDSCNEHLE